MRLIIGLLFIGFLSIGTAAAQYVVAVNGNDSNAGTAAAPFATLFRARAAMRSTSTKVTQIRGGVYLPPADSAGGVGCQASGLAAINLTGPADNGETWTYYPADGYNSAILDGGAPFVTQTGASFGAPGALDCAFAGDSSVTNITINGLQFRFWNYGALAVWQGAFTFTNNIIHDTRLTIDGGVPIQLNCGDGSLIANNYIYNVPYHGLAVGSGGGGCPVSNVTVSGNYIFNSCTWQANMLGPSGGDCGGIYVQLPNMANSNVQITNNYIRDVNVASGGHGTFSNFCCTIGTYLDGTTYNVTVTGNVYTGVHSHCFLSFGGGNTFTHNLCDIGPGPSGQYIGLDVIQFKNPMTMVEEITGGSSFQHNVVVTNTASQTGGAAAQGYNVSSQGGTPHIMAITNNAYWNYNGTSVFSGPNPTGTAQPGDTNPVYEDPKLSGYSVGQLLSSAVFGSPVSFICLVGNWGPPGFTIPATGTAPSWPPANIGTGCIGTGGVHGIAVVY